MTRTEDAAARVFLALATTCLLLLAAFFAYAPIFAVDFFWQLKLGEVIASTHALPRTDMFSAVHPERPYVQFQWLWELLAYGAYALHGLTGVRLFQAATLVASFAVLLRFSTRLLASRALAIAFCALALVLFEDRIQARPSATALGFLALTLPWLIDARAREGRGAVVAVLAVACVWSNIHSGESLLIALCFLALSVGSVLALKLQGKPRADAVRDGKLLLASCGGIALSPAFLAGIGDWTRAIGPQLATGNKEWLPTYTMLENGVSPSHVLIAFGPTLVTLVYAIEQRQRLRDVPRADWPLSEWLLCAGMLVLAHQAVRNAFLCLVPIAFMFARAPRAMSRRSHVLVALLTAALLWIAFDDHVIEGYGGIAEAAEIVQADLTPQTFPEELSAFMRKAKIEGGIFNDGRWGGYLIWELWPACHVFADSRHDFTPEMWPPFMASQLPHTRPAAMDEAFARWGIELAAFRGPTFPTILASSDWQLLYKAGDQELYQHRAGQHARQNLGRARSVLQRETIVAISEDNYATVAQEVGAKVWLAAPTQRRARARAQVLMRSRDPQEKRQGMFIESELHFDAGSYASAYALLGQLVALGSPDAVALYRYALAAYAVGEHAQARSALSELARRVSELSNAQLSRLTVLEKALRVSARN